MIKGFPIDFVRATFEQTLLEQHLKNTNFYGGRNQVRIFSLYEQLLKGDDVDRYKENFEDLARQQNRSGLILNGVVTAPTNPTITNLYSCTIIPLEYVCSLRCNIENRDQSLETVNNLIEELKGSKVDIAELKCENGNGFAYAPFIVGTIGHNEGAPKLENGDYIGDVADTTEILDKVYDLTNKHIDNNNGANWLYCGNNGKIRVANKVAGRPFFINDPLISSYSVVNGKVIANIDIETESAEYTTIPLYLDEDIRGSLTLYGTNEQEINVSCETKINSVELVNGHVVFHLTCTCNNELGENFDEVTWAHIELCEAEYTFIEDDGSYPNIIFPPEHVSFKKYKMSLSFEALRCDEPANLEDGEYVRISFGGSATIQDAPLRFGNDLVKTAISKYGLMAETPITFANPTLYWVEPLEMPSGNNPNIKVNQLVSNNFKSNTHTDSISPVLQYSFVVSDDIPLLEQWFEYGRYGEVNVNSSSELQTMSPNLIYNVYEIWSYWGNVKTKVKKTRIADSTDIDVTEGDTMTVSVTMQIQGDND